MRTFTDQQCSVIELAMSMAVLAKAEPGGAYQRRPAARVSAMAMSGPRVTQTRQTRSTSGWDM
jgi:hypothetical protein